MHANHTTPYLCITNQYFNVMATKFFFCETCGNVIVKFVSSGVTPVCCGAEMKELVPGVTDGAGEKHLPVIEQVDECTIKVKVGAQVHPMTKGHHIVFIYLETKHGGQVKYLDPEGEAEAVFCLGKDKPVAVYEYCNIHGLWKTDIEGSIKKCVKDK